MVIIISYYVEINMYFRNIVKFTIFSCAKKSRLQMDRQKVFLYFLPFLFLLIHFAECLSSISDSLNASSHHNHSENHHQPNPHQHGVKVASFKLEYVKAELILTLFILVIGLFKLRKKIPSINSPHILIMAIFPQFIINSNTHRRWCRKVVV
jgi:hypothetical protein